MNQPNKKIPQEHFLQDFFIDKVFVILYFVKNSPLTPRGGILLNVVIPLLGVRGLNYNTI
jgi:hypothetical protein